jgi:hypothetical protein
MDLNPTCSAFKDYLFRHLEESDKTWLAGQMDAVCHPPSTRNLYLTYSLIGRKLPENPLLPDEALAHGPQLPGRGAVRVKDLGRVYLLCEVLREAPACFIPAIDKLIQVADTGELTTFLRFLSVLPQAGEFRQTAVEALRTNISPVFEAIAMDNPYPKTYFNEQQWNQMYLKASFMGLDLLRIQGIDERANESLARIISDYAHERWAASRKVDPLIWQPVAKFISGPLLSDVQRLLASSELAEQKAGFLCAHQSGDPQARQWAQNHELFKTFTKNPFTWKDIKN